MAILDSFRMIKVWDLLYLPEEEIISFLGNDYLFGLHTTWDTIMHSANLFLILPSGKLTDISLK